MGFRLIDGFDRAGLEVVFGEEEVLAALLNLGFGETGLQVWIIFPWFFSRHSGLQYGV